VIVSFSLDHSAFKFIHEKWYQQRRRLLLSSESVVPELIPPLWTAFARVVPPLP